MTPKVSAGSGDTVRIQETRPISRTKHWRLLEILSRRQVADVQAIELEGDAVIEPVADAEDDDAMTVDDIAEEITDDDEDA